MKMRNNQQSMLILFCVWSGYMLGSNFSGLNLIDLQQQDSGAVSNLDIDSLSLSKQFNRLERKIHKACTEEELLKVRKDLQIFCEEMFAHDAEKSFCSDTSEFSSDDHMNELVLIFNDRANELKIEPLPLFEKQESLKNIALASVALSAAGGAARTEAPGVSNSIRDTILLLQQLPFAEFFLHSDN